MATAVRDRPGRLLERTEPLATLDRAARGVAAGEGSLVVLGGAAGQGKTRLLEEFARRAERMRLRVLTARGLQLEREFGFGVARQLIDPLLARASQSARRELFQGAAALAEPLFGGAPAAPDATGFATLHGLWWLLANIALVEPVVLLIDDTHWADAASTRWLAFVAPRIAEVPALVVAAGRTDEASQPAEWGALGGLATDTIELAPLSVDATRRLLEERLGVEPAAEFAAACQLATGGNPFLLTELARELAVRGISPNREEAISVAKIAPDTVERAVVSRLDAEPGESGQLARSIAVLGDGVPLGHAAELAQLDERVAGEAAVRLTEAGILRRAETLTFEHPIVRDAVYRSIVPVARAAMHRRAADVLEHRGQDVERRAAHLLLAEPAHDASVVALLREAAAAAAARGAMDAAAEYLTRAAAEPPRTADRPAVLAELGHAEVQCGRPDAAVHLREAAATAEEPGLQGSATGELATLLLARGDVDGAIALADEQRALLGEGALSLALETELISASSIAGARVWAKLSDRLRALAPAARTAGAAGQPLLALLATDEIRRGGSQAATAELALAALADDVLLARGADYPPFLHAIYALIRGGHTRLAIDILARAIAQARDRGSLLGFGFASCYRASAHMLRSELDAAEADLRTALEAARDNGWTLLEWQTLAFHLILLAERGSVEEAQAELERGGLEGELPENQITTGVLSGRANVRYAQGRWRDAYDDFIDCGRREAPYSESSQITWWRADAAMALAHLNELEQALVLAEAEVVVARAWGDPVNIGRALHARGLAKDEGGIEDLEAAARTLDGVYELGLASCLVDLGALLRRTKRRADARVPLRRGLELSERIGAQRYADRARIELAASGARPRSVVRIGVDSLTPSELRISRLAAEGLSNPQIAQQLFVTRKTVEKHLASVFLKLDISSRAQLPELLSGPAD